MRRPPSRFFRNAVSVPHNESDKKANRNDDNTCKYVEPIEGIEDIPKNPGPGKKLDEFQHHRNDEDSARRLQQRQSREFSRSGQMRNNNPAGPRRLGAIPTSMTPASVSYRNRITFIGL